MDELAQLRTYIERGQYNEALNLIGEMEEMSKDDKINKITSFMEILLLHLIKQAAEKRTTRSWNVSINNSLRQIARINKRRRSGGYYLEEEDLREALSDAWPSALELASLEAFEGRYEPEELARMIEEKHLKEKALELILNAQKGRGL